MQQCIILFRICHSTNDMCRLSGRTNRHLSGKWNNFLLKHSSSKLKEIIGWFWRSIGDAKWEPLGSDWCHLLGQGMCFPKFSWSLCKCLWWSGFFFIFLRHFLKTSYMPYYFQLHAIGLLPLPNQLSVQEIKTNQDYYEFLQIILHQRHDHWFRPGTIGRQDGQKIFQTSFKFTERLAINWTL